MQATHPSLNTLINFCFEPFVSSVCCESVAADGYSCSNLVAGDFSMRSRGLRVEHYIRPPVTISIEFRVPVDVSYILICPDLPLEAEMKVELSGWTRGGRGGAERRLSQGPLLGTSGSLLVAKSKHLHTNIQTQEMASVPSLANMVVHRSYIGKDLKKLEPAEFSLKDVNVLRQLKHLQLKVIRWTGPKPVSIKWLEVWGLVSNTTSREDMALFQSNFKASACSPNPHGQPPSIFRDEESSIVEVSASCSEPPVPFSCSPSPQQVSTGYLSKAKLVDVEKSSAATSSVVEGVEVPEQFLDELTFEVMVLPMLLPSGHCVDQSTLDRLGQSDSTYGRPPTDPFTGIAFTELCKPKFCAQLKTQLDNYLFIGSGQDLRSRTVCSSADGDTKSLTCGHTLGSASEIQQHLLRTGKCVSSANDSLSPASKRVKLQCDWTDDCSGYKGIESVHPASANTGVPSSSSSATHCTDHNLASATIGDRIPPHEQAVASSFDVQVGNSLEVALNQLLHNRNNSSNHIL